MKEVKQVTGDIQNIRKDFKAIQLLGNWYSSFYVIDDFEKGDYVKVQYSENTKDGKTFLNIKNIEMVEAKREESKQEKSTPQIPDTTINTILIISKDIHNKLIEKDQPSNLKEIAKEVTESYKLIKSLV